jgi:hypothetical protein
MSLTIQDPSQLPADKTAADADTFQARFIALIREEKIVWSTEFESEDPSLAGEMTVTFALAHAEEGTEVVALRENIPEGIRLEDNEAGCRSSLQNLAKLLE